MPRRNDVQKVLIIGSGPIVIGQACEFDYSGTQACKALRELGYQIVLVNSNPATIMTDPSMADVTYIEPLNARSVTEIIEKERPDALLPNLGGQTGLNLASDLARTGVLDKYDVQVIGVGIDAIERGEDRTVFKALMATLGIAMPESKAAYNVEEAESIAEFYRRLETGIYFVAVEHGPHEEAKDEYFQEMKLVKFEGSAALNYSRDGVLQVTYDDLPERLDKYIKKEAPAEKKKKVDKKKDAKRKKKD